MTNIKKIQVWLSAPALLLGGILIQSCAEWTEPESVEIKVNGFKDRNPEQYSQYLQSLRDYKNSEHKLTVAKFDNIPGVSFSQAYYLNSLPDSIDYVILSEPDNLSDVIIADMAEIRNDRGTKTMYSIRYEDIEEEYKVYVENFGQSSENDKEIVPYKEFLSERMDAYIALSEKYSYDGINVMYKGVFPGSLKEEEKKEVLALQSVVFDKIKAWKSENPDKILSFEGLPINIMYDNSIFDTIVDFIIVDATEAKTSDEFTYKSMMAFSEPSVEYDIILEISATYKTENGKVEGLLETTDENGQNIHSVIEAANWINIHNGKLSKSGICVEHTQQDYFNKDGSYKDISRAISRMNNSPVYNKGE